MPACKSGCTGTWAELNAVSVLDLVEHELIYDFGSVELSTGFPECITRRNPGADINVKHSQNGSDPQYEAPSPTAASAFAYTTRPCTLLW